MVVLFSPIAMLNCELMNDKNCVSSGHRKILLPQCYMKANNCSFICVMIKRTFSFSLGNEFAAVGVIQCIVLEVFHRAAVSGAP